MRKKPPSCTDAELLRYALEFTGTGNPHSPYWFITAGPSYPRPPFESDFPLEDWPRYERRRLTRRILRLAARGATRFDGWAESCPHRESPPYEAALEHLQQQSPRSEPRVSTDIFRAEFWPLTPPGLAALGTPSIFSAYMHSQRAFSAYFKIARLNLFRAALGESASEIVVMFGATYDHIWREVPYPCEGRWAQTGCAEWQIVSNRLYIVTEAANPFSGDPTPLEVASTIGRIAARAKKRGWIA